MTKRGRKSETNTAGAAAIGAVTPAKKGRPPGRTRSKTSSSDKAVVPSKTETTKKTNSGGGGKKSTKASPKPKKSTESKPKSKTKTTTASPKKSPGKASLTIAASVQKTPSKPPAKRGRKSKIKNTTPDKKVVDVKPPPPPMDDEDTEEEHMSDSNEMNQKSAMVAPSANILPAGSDQVGDAGIYGGIDGGHNVGSQFKPHVPTKTQKSSRSRFESAYDSQSHSANFSLGSLYNSQKMISSSSTSAFSVPVPPPPTLSAPMATVAAAAIPNPQEFNANHLLPRPMMADETSMSNMMPATPVTRPPVASSHHLPPVIASSHQSLLSPPQNSANPNDPVHDLPAELLQQGWRKFWSRREGRPYYFNRNTNESLWEMPKLSNVYDPMTDPLGIQSMNATFQPPSVTPTDPGTPPIYPVFTPPFLHFMQKNVNLMNNDKKTYIGPFDFEIESNCYTWEGLFFYYFHPHPEVESTRFNHVHKLRQHYYELCRARQNIDPPKDSFTKWILERKAIDKGCDPFLPSECIPEMSQSLYNEIMNDIPIKLVKPKFSGEARKQLSKYAEAAKKIIDSPHVSAMSRKIVKWNVEDAFEWIRKTLNATYEDYIERLEHLKKQCQPHIIEAAKSSVESICMKIFHVSADYSRRIRDSNLEVFRKEDLKERGPTRFSNQKKVICYPAYLINPCPKLPLVQSFTEKDSTLLRFKNGEFIRFNTSYMQKLEFLYYFNCRDDRKYSLFLPRVWCLMKRYQSFFDKTEGLSSQNSLPLSVFGALNKHFGVTFECFASPLNCYFRQYCSLFPDTDGYFGSRGSILNFYPVSGSFQANPPDSDDLIDASITHFEKLLENSMEPLSFIIFIQEKAETPQKIVSRLESNKFKRERLSVQQMEHEYRHGFQHLCPRAEMSVKSLSNTLIYFLQNDAGFLRWGPTPERVEELMESFKLGSDTELTMLSPSSTPAGSNQKPVPAATAAAGMATTTIAPATPTMTEPMAATVDNRPNGI